MHFGVDWSGNKLLPLCPAVVQLDLTCPLATARLEKLLSHRRLTYVHFAPPCGTASRAREIVLRGSCPRPLRSSSAPRGLPNLAEHSPLDQLRVDSANKLYDIVAKLAGNLTSRQVVWSIENPRNSLIWWILCVEDLLKFKGSGDVFFAHCMFGGSRPKVTRLRCWPSHAFQSLARLCDNSHVHAPWGRVGGSFATAQETSYPEGLCKALARAVATHLDLGDLPRLQLDSCKRTSTSKKEVAAHRIASGVQPRGARAPRLLPEFRQVLSLDCALPPSDPRAKIGHKWQQQVFQEVLVPEDSVTISARWRGDSGHLGLEPPTRGQIDQVTKLGDNDLYIGRGSSKHGSLALRRSKWANPFRVSECRDASGTGCLYRVHLRGSTELVTEFPCPVAPPLSLC